ncbi:MAG: energy transducer TonB, partial [Deltaproteobacteria bacterium]|nr:energy transducer TonB [Deltaproteobacteria bacterium]
TPAASASQPPITEVQRPIPGHPDSVEAVPSPIKQASPKITGSGIDQPILTGNGQIVENHTRRETISGKANLSEGKGNTGTSHEQLQQQYLSAQFTYIKRLIQQNLTYPPLDRKAGWAGKVTVSFIVLESGRADSIKILKSSGYSILDNNVIKTITEVSPFPKPPVTAELQMPIIYQLE